MGHPAIEDEGDEVTSTTWHNPTAEDVKVRLYRGHGVKPGKSHFVLTIPAGGSKTISSEHDAAIRLMREGVVVGGLAPQLVKVDEKHDPPEVHESLDVPSPRRGGRSPAKGGDKDKGDPNEPTK